MTNATFHVYLTKAYRSEIALFRAEGVTAINAEQVGAPADTRRFWRVEGAGRPVFLLDGREAFAAFTAALGTAMGGASLAEVSTVD